MRYAFRILAREKGFTCVAVLTLALGIAAVSAIFSVVHCVLLKPLEYSEPGRLYAVAESLPKLPSLPPRLPVNAGHFHSWMTQCGSCSLGALLKPASFSLTGEGEPERIDGVSTTWDLFRVLGVPAQLGRTFDATDDQPGNNRYVVLTDRLWRRRFQASRDIVGKPIRLDGEPHVVIGILPAGFRFPKGDQLGLMSLPEHAEIFKPLGLEWAGQRRVGSHNYLALMRLRPGASPERAQTEMTALVADAAHLMGTDLKTSLTPLQEQMMSNSRTALWVLMAAVGAVLAIVCVNLGNLMLVRAGGRLRDAALRQALGASRGQLFRPIMTESLVLAFAGGLLGVLLAYAGVQAIVNTAPADTPRLDEVHVDAATWLLAFLVSAGCGILCGLWPAWRMSRSQPVDALKAGGRAATESGGRLRAREWLVGFEVALSTVLLVVAALLGLSFLRLTGVERGFEVDRVLTANVNLPASRYPGDEAKKLFHQRMIEKLESLPGVKWAGLVSALPLAGESWGELMNKEGETRPLMQRPTANFRFVSSHYFEAMGIALRAGRAPTEADRSPKGCEENLGTPLRASGGRGFSKSGPECPRFLSQPHKVAVISESVARKVWPNEDALGKRIKRTDDPAAASCEVIGVVADVRTVSLEKQPPLMVYVPYWDGAYWQGGVWGNASYVLRTSQDPSGMANAFRGAVRSLDPELPLAGVRTMGEVLGESVARRWFQTSLAGVFAVSAMLLACLGIYGVISYSVTRRTNEMGVRTALGAPAAGLALMVLRQGMKPVVAGLGVGVLGALWAGQLLGSLLFGVSARDPATISVVVVLLLGVAALACWGPARRASRVDPLVALHYE